MKQHRELKKGMEISFFGTPYTINEVVDFDIVEVIQNNGVPIKLWFPDLSGREILKTTKS